MLDKRRFYIDGEFVGAGAGRDLPVIDPATGRAVAVIALGDAGDVDRAVAAARRAFPGWAATPLDTRLGMLRTLLRLYEANKSEMVAAITMEMGAPASFCEEMQWDAGRGHLEATIAALESFSFETPDAGGLLLREPIGVAGLITPWNWPMNQVMLKVAPALGTGCTCVLKPSEIAPLSSMLLAEMIHEAGFPPGVFNLVNGDGPGVGAALSAHPGVDMVSFTGSGRAGTAIARAAAPTAKRVTLELGGKGANLIFADRDAEAVRGGVLGCFENTGQSCNAPTRMLVERSVYPEVVAEAAEIAASVPVDLPGRPGPHIGPLVSAAQWDKVQELIRAGLDEGARLVAGGPGRPEGLEEGFFVRPTVFADVTPGMRIAREEIFGPVLSIPPFDTEEEAIALANDTPYGLGNYVQTADPGRAVRVARALRSGMVHVNGAGIGYDIPFGGYRQSGNGREGARWGVEDFLEIKVVAGL